MTALHARMLERERSGEPVSVAVVGAGTFGGMFLAQARRVPGIRIAVVADLDPARAEAALAAAGWDRGRAAPDVTADAEEGIGRADVDLVVEATGDPLAAVRHARAAFAEGHDVVNVTVEADALLGPLLAAEADAASVVYSMAHGDQPALICELVDWARVNALPVVCAGKGTRHAPGFERCTPDTVWASYGLDARRAQAAGYDARMFTSFTDGTKSAVEMAAVADATGLAPQEAGLRFPPAGVDDLATVCRPATRGGMLERAGTVEVVSSLGLGGAPVPGDLRWGVYVVVAAPDDRVAGWFADYGLRADPEHAHAALYRPAHLVGLELASSIASVAVRREATGTPAAFAADVVAVAKRDLPEGMALDGEGGHTVHGVLRPAASAVAEDALPIALARDVSTTRWIDAGEIVRRGDVDGVPDEEIAALRRRMEHEHLSRAAEGPPLWSTNKETR